MTLGFASFCSLRVCSLPMFLSPRLAPGWNFCVAHGLGTSPSSRLARDTGVPPMVSSAFSFRIPQFLCVLGHVAHSLVGVMPGVSLAREGIVFGVCRHGDGFREQCSLSEGMSDLDGCLFLGQLPARLETDDFCKASTVDGGTDDMD